MSYSVPFCLQIEALTPFQAVAERFKEQYKTLATALDATRHELPVRGIHMQGSGKELLGKNSPAVWPCFSRKEPQGSHAPYSRCLYPGVVLEPVWNEYG